MRLIRHLRYVISALAPLALLAIAFAAGLAFAQAPIESTTVVASDDLGKLAGALYEAIVKGNWWLAMGPAVTLLVFLLRRYDTKIPKVGPAIDAFLNQPMVAFSLPIVLSAIGGWGSAAASGQPVGLALLSALKVAGTSVITFLLAKNAAEQVKSAGDKAAAAVATPQAAVDAINKS